MVTLRSAVAHDGRPATCGDPAALGGAALVAGALPAEVAGGEPTAPDPDEAGVLVGELAQAAVRSAAKPTTRIRLILDYDADAAAMVGLGRVAA
jgi:hypothetical protein